MATLTKGKTFVNGELVTPQKLHELVDLGTVSGIVNADVSNTAAIALSKLATGALPTGITVASANIVDGTIVNADISASAAIADSKLATISTAGKVSNSATTAASTNIANAIVTRDSLGSFSANTITAALAGNASTASKLATARTISLTGAVTGSTTFDGAGNASIATTHTADPVITLTGDVTGSGTMTNLGNVSITATVADDSHNHIIANIDGLQTALDGKQAAGSYAPATGIAPSAITGTAVITTDSRLSNARTPTAHTHDDRYYTEAEIDAKLAGLPVSGHTHAATDITSGTLAIARIPTGTTSTTVALGNHTHSGYAASSHTHDDRYYTETEVNTLLAGKLGTTATAAAATKLATARTISLTGDVTGSATFDGSANASITAVVADDSHNHIIANVDGLQAALDGKQAAGSYVTNGGAVSSIQRVTAMPASPAANTLYIVIP